jgi:hypothetical protein
LQIVEGFAGALPVTPGWGEEAPGVKGDGVPINNVEVGRAINVGVAGAGVAGDAHPTKRITPVKKAGSILVFIIISSLIAYLIIKLVSKTLFRHCEEGVFPDEAISQLGYSLLRRSQRSGSPLAMTCQRSLYVS